MSAMRVLVIGAGERVALDTLPALASLEPAVEIVGVYSRTPRRLAAAGRDFDVRPLDELDGRGLGGVDLVHVVVAKQAVPSVLARLARHDRGSVALQLETPGLLYKHLAHRDGLDAWRDVWVSEDCTTLPFLDTVDAYVASGALGEPRHLLLDRSAYAYHGIALAKRVLGARHVVAARRRGVGGGLFERTLALDNGTSATIREPRDYALGSFRLTGTRGSVSDAPGADARLALVLDGTRCTGHALGRIATRLSPAEQDLLGDVEAGDGRVVPHMHGHKRVGLRRLFERLARGERGYALASGLEDMGVDYHLEKLGRYWRNPFTGAHARLPGRLLGLLGRR